MSAATQYLEAAKIEELVQKFLAKGYTVEQDAPAGPGKSAPRYDILARHGDDTIAIEVKASGQLRSAASEIAQLRAHAHAMGFKEFQLVVAQPPRRVNVVVEGLEQKLTVYLVEHTPEALRYLSSYVRVEEVYDVDIDELTDGVDGMRVTGTGLVRVNLAFGGGAEKDGLDMFESFPFHYRVMLDAERRMTVAEIDVDTSGWED